MTMTRHSWLFSKKLYRLILNETRENFKQNFFDKELHKNNTRSSKEDWKKYNDKKQQQQVQN